MSLSLAWFPNAGVYLLLDEVAREFYVGYTTSMSGAIGRIWELSRGRPALGCSMLTVTDDETTLRLHAEYYRNIWIEKGYSELIARGRKSLQFKVRIVVAPGFNGVDVELANARGQGLIVGRFKTKGEAQEFAMVYYGEGNDLRLPVYATNSLTRELLLDIGKPNKLLL